MQNWEELQARYKQPKYSFSFWRTLGIGVAGGIIVTGLLTSGIWLKYKVQNTELLQNQSELEYLLSLEQATRTDRSRENILLTEELNLRTQKLQEAHELIATYEIGSNYNHNPFRLPKKVLTKVETKTEMVGYIFEVFAANGRRLSSENNYPNTLEVEFQNLIPGSNLSQIANHLQSVEGMEITLKGSSLEARLSLKTQPSKEFR